MSLPEESKQNERSQSFYLLASADTGAQNTTKNCAIYHDVQKSYHKKKSWSENKWGKQRDSYRCQFRVLCTRQ